MKGLFRISGIALTIGLPALLFMPRAGAADLKWTGTYRVEGNFIRNYTLSSGSEVENSYLTNHLIMEPEIIAADGLKIHSRFDIFNNALGNNQIGQVFGNYTTNGQTTPPGTNTTALSAETIAVNALYMNWVNEFSQLTVGRVPFDFGLGMTYNSGKGPFDHWLSNKDMVGYTLVMGNLSVMPAYAKVREGALTNEDDVNEFIVKVQYDNAESDLSMGFLFNNRVAPVDNNAAAAGIGGNDSPTAYFNSINPGYTNATIFDGYSTYNMNFFVKKKSDNFNVGVEVGFQNGYTGIQMQDGSGNWNRVGINGFGAAGEIGYKSGNWDLNLRAGIASGDDPTTVQFEGYYFHPNYDIAWLMFNYPLGQFDVNRTTLAGSRPYAGAAQTASQAALNGIDSEVISNAIYFAPNVKLALGERYDLLATFAYATQAKPSYTGASAASLGFETDLGLSYHPSDKFTWINSVGFLFPGAAFQGNPTFNYPTDMVYGATSKAAINF